MTNINNLNSKIIIASGPVIVRDKKVLLDKSGADDFWKFCGGKIKENQNLKETAINRAKEELGIDVELLDKKPFLMYTPKPGNEEFDVILVHFLADFKGDIQVGEMVREWEWLDIDNLPNDIAPNIIPALEWFGFVEK